MNKLILTKTIKEWMKEEEEYRDQALEARQYGYANYTDGKVRAYQEVLNLLHDIKNFGIEIAWEV